MNNQDNIISDLVKTLLFAAEAHKDQKRKGSGGSPYINHLIECASLLIDIGNVKDLEIIQAAILHDVLEDTLVNGDQLREIFGDNVTEYVNGVTDQKGLPLEERRLSQIKHLANASDPIKLIKIVDHCSNISSIPPNWTIIKIKSYIEWSRQIVSLCSSVSEKLTNEYDHRYKKAVNEYLDFKC